MHSMSALCTTSTAANAIHRSMACALLGEVTSFKLLLGIWNGSFEEGSQMTLSSLIGAPNWHPPRNSMKQMVARAAL